MKTPMFIAVWTKNGVIKGIKIGSDFTKLTDYLDPLFADPLTQKAYEARIFNQDEQEIARYCDEENDDEEERDDDENAYVDDDKELFYRG